MTLIDMSVFLASLGSNQPACSANNEVLYGASFTTELFRYGIIQTLIRLMWKQRLVCAFVVFMQQRRVFSCRGALDVLSEKVGPANEKRYVSFERLTIL